MHSFQLVDHVYARKEAAAKMDADGIIEPGTKRLLAPKTLTVHFTFTQEELRCDEL